MEQDNIVPWDKQTRRKDKQEECKIENVARNEIENKLQMEKWRKAADTIGDQKEDYVEPTLSCALSAMEIEQVMQQGEDEKDVKLETYKTEMKAEAAEVQEHEKVEESAVEYNMEVQKIDEDGRSRPYRNPFLMPDIVEQIVKFCDGTVLINLKNTSSLFRKFVGNLEKKQYFWRNKCHEKIPKNHILEMANKNCFVDSLKESDYPEWFWRKTFVTWHKWKSISKCNYRLKECSVKFDRIKCMKTCGDKICISTYNGFWIMDPKIGYHRKLTKRDCSNFFFLIDSASVVLGEKLPFSALRIQTRNKFLVWLQLKNEILFEQPSRSDLDFKVAPQGMYDFVTHIGPARDFGGTFKHNPPHVETAVYTCQWGSITRTYSKTEESLYLVLQDWGFKMRVPFEPAPIVKTYGFRTDRPSSIYIIANIVILGMEHGYILIYDFENVEQYKDMLSIPPTKRIDLPPKEAGPVLFIDVLCNGLNQNPTIVAATNRKIYTVEFYLPRHSFLYPTKRLEQCFG